MKYLADSDIEQLSLNFLNQYHQSLLIPIPIEKILSKALKVKLVPVSDLKSEFGIDGCLSRDMSQVYVDMNQLMNSEFRTRFTIAHEIGHLILHKEYIKNLSLKMLLIGRR